MIVKSRARNKYLYIAFLACAIIFVNATDIFAASVVLSWDAPTTNSDGTPLNDLAGYKVYYGTSSGSYSQNVDVGNVTTYQVNNLTAGLTYYFVTTAYDTSGNESGYSNEISRTIQSADTTPPSIPNNPRASAVSPTQVSLSWDASTDNVGVTGYIIYRDGTRITTTSSTSYQDSGLSPSTTYSYAIKAFDAAGNQSNTSSSVSVTTDQASSGTFTIINTGDNWKYLKGTSNPASGWNNTSFDDSAWLEGQTGIGYGDGDDATVLSDMANSYLTIYTRKKFDISDSSVITGMSLSIDYDDGFVAYLNGQEIARANMPTGTPNYNTAATGREAGTAVTYNLSSYISTLVTGMNVLAIEVHNRSLGSSDLSFIPELIITTSAPDTTPPVISGVKTSNITSSSVTISWSTDEASDTQIEYGTSTSYGNTTVLNSSMTTNHSQGISGLSSSTVYHYRVRSRDASGNLAVSSDYTFTTSAPPVTVSYYCDSDNDGYIDVSIDGVCTGTGCEPSGCQTTPGNDCNDGNSAINPGETDDTCDGIDNNCNGTPDDDYVTTTVTCGKGVCSSTGQIQCQAGTEVNTCSPGTPQEYPDETTCNDGLDNDCDGQVDEGCYPDIVVSEVLLNEDFSSGIPATWTVQGAWSANNQCSRMINYPFAGSFAIVDSSCMTTGVDELVTASFDADSCSSVELVFSNQYYWYAGNIEVDVSDDGGTTWGSIISISTDAGYPSPDWKEIDISTVAGSSDAQIKFKYSNSSTDGFWAIDNVWVTCRSNQLQFASRIQSQDSKTVMITNAGTDDLAISAISIGGTNATEFDKGVNDDCSGETLLPDEACTFDIVFTPVSTGSKTAGLYISSNDPDTPTLNIVLYGMGTDVTNPSPRIKVNGLSGSVNVSRGDNFPVTIELDPGSLNGEDGDWWVLMEHRKRWYYYNASTKRWKRGFSVYHQGQLSNSGPIEIQNISRLSRGQYIFHFGIDNIMNGIQDTNQYYQDSITINIQ